ncbi:MAG: methyltransferase domain-containing protein [Thermoanaerobaculia bacterium]
MTLSPSDAETDRIPVRQTAGGGKRREDHKGHVYEFKDFAGSSHRILMELIRVHSRRGGVLLDLGAFAGELGAAVRNHFTRTIAWEYVLANIGLLGSRFDSVIIADLEQVSRFPPNADAIVMADVLEHMKYPGEVLDKALESLSPGGRLFVSVPNVANLAIRASLLVGRFEYAERGILDSTHLRFYTRRTARREIEAAGLTILTERVSIVPLRFVFTSIPDPILSILERILIGLTRLWPTLLGYQFIFVAERQD